MKTFINVLGLFFLSHHCLAQASSTPTNLAASYNLDRMSDFRGVNSSELVLGIPMAPGKVVGDTYLSEEWKTGTVLLYDNDKMIERYPLRYDIKVDEIEIKASNGIKVLSGKNVKSFTWVEMPGLPPVFFINAKDMKAEDGTRLTGFLQVLEDGIVPLFKQTYIQVKRADYNVSLNVGSTDDKLLKKEEFYMLYEDKLVKTPGSKKKLLPYFGEHAPAMEEFIKERGIGVTKQPELQSIFNYYNSLLQKK